LKPTAMLAVGVTFLFLLSSIPVGQASSSAPFTVVGASWGSGGKTVEAAPGVADVPLTVTAEYQGSLEALSIRGLLQLGAAATGQQVAAGFTDIYGNTTATASVFSVSPGSTFTLVYYVDIANTTKVGAYSIPIELEWTDSTTGSSGYEAQSAAISLTMLGIPDVVFTATPAALLPGRVDNLTLTVSNWGSGTASQLDISDSATGVSVLNPVFEVQSLAPGQSRSMRVGIYVPAALSGNSVSMTVTAGYNDAYGNAQSGVQTIGLYAARASTPILSFEALSSSIGAGETNSVPLALTNLGTGTASDIHIQITSSGQSSVLTQFPVVGTLGPNASTTSDVSVYVPQSLAGSPLSLTLAASYTDEFGNTGTYSQIVGLYVANSTASLPTTLISVTPVRSALKVGAQSPVAFSIENAGSDPLTSPVLSLSVSSPLVVTQNSTYAVKGGVLQPGQTVVYDAVIGAGTSSTPGFYSASVGVTYLDSSGTLKSAAFSLGLVLSGNIEMVVQSPTVTQANSSIVVAGSILNEGFSSAYYAGVTGSVGGSKDTSAQDYVGEVDPNTPIPFSVTIAYTPQANPSRANITVVVSYTDSLGQSARFTTTVPTTLKSAGQLFQSQGTGSTTTSSGTDSFTYLEYGVVAALVLVAVIGAVLVRRNRAASYTAGGSAKEKSDHDVI